MKSRILCVIVSLAVALCTAGCAADSEGAANAGRGASYGSISLGEEQVPVNLVKVYDADGFLMVLLSPLTDEQNLTTSLIVGLKSELQGSKVDVERLYCNDDYIVVYDDPQCYYAPFRPLQSGEIEMSKEGGTLRLSVDVVLYDGTPLRYQASSLPM